MKSPSIVICDEKTSASRIRKLLGNLGYTNFSIVSQKKELQDLLKPGLTDLLIVDADCGEKEDCMEESYQFCHDNNIPIVYIIPHSGNWLEEKAADLDTYGYLFKPVRQRELHLTIEGTLSRHRSKKELERQLNELSLIHDISQAAASIRNIDDLLQYITNRISELLEASAVYIALDEPESNLVHFRCWNSQIPNISCSQIPRDLSLTGEVIKKRKTILINQDFVTQAKKFKGVFSHEGRTQTPKSWLGVPIIAMNESIGAICVQDFELENAFSEEQVNLLDTIAANVAIALSNAKLFTSFQEELAQRTAREAELLESHRIARMGGWEIDRSSMDMRWSEGVYDVLELDPISVKPSYETFISFSHPDDLDKTIQEVTQNARERKESSVTSRLVMPDGRIKWIYQRCRVECDENGKVIRFVGIIHDITELKLAEEQLNLHSTALEAAANGLMITDREGIIQWVNPAFTAMTGYTLEDAKGNTPRLLKSGVQPKEFYQELWATIKGGNTWHGEMYDRHKDGHLVLIEQYIAPVRDADNVITHFIVIMIDISDRSEIQKQLKLQSTALEAAGNAIVITNPKGYIEWVNPAFTTLTGYSYSDAVSSHTRILKSGAHSADFYQNLWSTIRSGNVWRGEMYNRRKNGENYHEEMIITPVLDEKNNVSHFIAIKQDITERVEAEARLKQYAEDQAALYAVAAASTAQLEPNDLLTTTLDVILAIPHLAVSSGWVLLLDEKSAATMVVTSRNISDEFIQAEVNNEKGLCPICVEATQNSSVEIKTSVMGLCTRIPKNLIEKEGLTTHVAIPLKIGEQILGVLNLGWRASNEYLERYQTLLNNIGRQISLALHHAMLYQDALQVNRLRLVNQIGKEISSSLDLDSVFSNMLELVCGVLGGKEGSIMLLEQPSGDLIVRHAFLHQVDRFRGRRIKKGEGFAGRVAELEQTIFVNDVHNDPRWNGELDTASNFETQTILCAPILHGKTVIGVIEIVNSEKGGFTKEDVLLIDAITPIAAVAIKNAQLFALTLRRAKELDTLNHIAQAVTKSLDSQVVVTNALQRIQQQFDATYVGLFNWDSETDTLLLTQMYNNGGIQTVEQQFADNETHVIEVIKSQEATMNSNLRADNTLPDKVRELVDSRRRSWMAAPLMIAERVIGAIEVTNEKVGFYTRHQLSVLESIAATMSIALENARLYEELKQALHEQERAQIYLIQSEKSAALGRLSATVAHEINNPLQAIQGCLGLFGEEMEGQNRQEKLNRYLRTVESEIDRIAAIVRRMRDFYRPSSMGFQAVDLAGVIGSVLDLSEKQLQNNEIVVKKQWAEHLPFVRANSDHLKQVFINMIINAIDAMPDGGNLRISIEPDVLTNKDGTSTEALKAIFSDTGHGIPSNVLSRLFEPFHTTKPHGTGLGLYVSHGIIQAHNGKIEVSSQPEIGTTFEIYIPTTKNSS